MLGGGQVAGRRLVAISTPGITTVKMADDMINTGIPADAYGNITTVKTADDLGISNTVKMAGISWERPTAVISPDPPTAVSWAHCPPKRPHKGPHRDLTEDNWYKKVVQICHGNPQRDLTED